MGYIMRQVDGKWSTILGQDRVALAALKALAEKSRDHYAREVMGEARHLDEAVAGWMFEAQLGPRASITAEQILALTFTGESAYNVDEFLGALAPFSTDGSFIEMQGEEGERYRWTVRGGRLKYQTGAVQFAWSDEKDV